MKYMQKYSIPNNNIIHNDAKVEATQCPLIDKWINKMWSIIQLDYSAIKRNDITDTYCKVDKFCKIVLSEKRMIQKNLRIVRFHLYVQNRQIHRIGIYITGCLGQLVGCGWGNAWEGGGLE